MSFLFDFFIGSVLNDWRTSRRNAKVLARMAARSRTQTATQVPDSPTAEDSRPNMQPSSFSKARERVVGALTKAFALFGLLMFAAIVVVAIFSGHKH